ncbi:unnamed protein product [Symbiodinium sp. CCMP2592]|nr:unnamed protein product [Symbiodinium sp. CCMP2592]
MAFVHSPALKPAVQRIADLLAEEGGNQKFNKLVDVVLEQLAVGRLDWQQISSSIPSLAADAPAAEVFVSLGFDVEAFGGSSSYIGEDNASTNCIVMMTLATGMLAVMMEKVGAVMKTITMVLYKT